MKKIAMTVVSTVIAGGAFAADFTGLQTLKSSNIDAALKNFSALVHTAAIPPVTDISGETPYSSSVYSVKAKAEAALERILKDAKKQGIPVRNQPVVAPLGKYYRFRIVFGPKMYIDSIGSYVMNEGTKDLLIQAVESAGGVYLETDYDAERGMNIYYVMPEGKKPQETEVL